MWQCGFVSSWCRLTRWRISRAGQPTWWSLLERRMWRRMCWCVNKIGFFWIIYEYLAKVNSRNNPHFWKTHLNTFIRIKSRIIYRMVLCITFIYNHVNKHSWIYIEIAKTKNNTKNKWLFPGFFILLLVRKQHILHDKQLNKMYIQISQNNRFIGNLYKHKLNCFVDNILDQFYVQTVLFHTLEPPLLISPQESCWFLFQAG